MSAPAENETPRRRAERIAASLGGSAGVTWFRAPGRVNLMGDHTDYNDGLVLPVAVDRDCLIAARPSADGRVRVRSLDVPAPEQSVDVAADGSDDPRATGPPWGRYVAGVVRALAERGRRPAGVAAALSSNVPPGSGLASSAALEVACALALCRAAGLRLPTRELALACQAAEQLATGVPCGVMDQLAALEGRAGSALLIDCRTLAVEPVALPRRLAVLVVHSGVRRELGATEYAARRRACRAIASELGLASLRDASAGEAAPYPLARHVVSENGRVLDAASALAAGDLARLGALFADSHRSLSDDYRVSTPELDALVAALAEAGAVGARLTGAGFGGSVVALAERPRAESVAQAAALRYRRSTGREATAFVCRAVGGAGPAVIA